MKDKSSQNYSRSGGFLGGEENDWYKQEQTSQQQNELTALGTNHYVFDGEGGHTWAILGGHEDVSLTFRLCMIFFGGQ